MLPTPIPAPPMPMQAMPAPMYLAATTSSFGPICVSLLLERGYFDPTQSMAGMEGIVEVQARQHREDVGLQCRDQKLQRRDGDGGDQRDDGGENPDRAERAYHHDETCEQLQGQMPGEHVGKETDGEAE